MNVLRQQLVTVRQAAVRSLLLDIPAIGVRPAYSLLEYEPGGNFAALYWPPDCGI